ncbi:MULTISPECIES: hypothetical protein [Nocardia]|uniref:hypothetical protein n=1 Tax=Nocardia TaxID=1817 RepID=UPI000D6996C0|nr:MULTISPECIES: hypothetical protein [Nocardia]
MPHDVITHPEHDRHRSLGWLAIAWMEYFLIHGPGDVGGDPVAPIIDEYCAFYVDTYALMDDGTRIYDHVFLSRPKGCAKSEVAACIGLFEAFGPCRFDGWAQGGEVYRDEWGLGFEYVYSPGEPMGKRIRNPYIRCVATEEDQAGLVYDTIYLNCTEGPLRGALNRRDEAGLTRILVPGGGEIVPSTSSAASKDGGKDTCTLFDEALALDTPLPTPTGFVTMGDVEIGDWLIGATGEPVRVVKTSQVMTDRDCYKVTFIDGTSLVASAGHLWHARSPRAKARTWTTEEMLLDGREFAIPNGAPWEAPEVDLDIDPYILGLWLGDGDKSNATISSSYDDAGETSRNIEACGYTVRRLTPKSGTADLIYVSIPGSHRNRFSPVRGFKVRLADANLLGDKHVPSQYLHASPKQRLALIQGLMDSDGSITPNGHCTFSNSSVALVEAMMQLLWSMGETPGRTYSADPRSRYGGYWRVTFTPRYIDPFRLTRKAVRVRADKMTRWMAIKSIEPVEPVPVKCVGVDCDDHLFRAGISGKVTHNTHLYNRPELRQTYKTLTRNLRKRRRSAGTLAVETTTMYAPGEDSIAEQTYKLIQDYLAGKLRRAPRQLFDHRYANITPEDLEDEDKVRAALLDSYGDCALWNDIEGYIEAIADPRNDTVSSFRYWFNAPTSAENAWIAQYEWDAVGPDNYAGDSILKPGEVIVLGFDGSRRRRRGVTDATALIACRIADGLISPIEVWAQPPGKYDEGWEVPEHDVEAKILWAFKTYKVIGFYADPAKWEANVAAWEAKYAKQLKVKASTAHPIEWWMTGQRAFRTVEALREFVEAMLDGKLHHDGDLTLRAHVLNARRAETTKGVQIRKENPDSPNKIDAAVAAVLAWQARLDAIAKGFGTQRRRRVAVRM